MQQTASPETEVVKRFRNLLGVMRFFAVLRKYGYIDPLLYSNDTDQIRNTVHQALREYKAYIDSAQETCNGIPCLEKVEQSDKRFSDLEKLAEIFEDTIHRCGNHICVAPTIRVKRDEGEARRLAYPSDDEISHFMDRVSSDMAYARALAGLALAK